MYVLVCLQAKRARKKHPETPAENKDVKVMQSDEGTAITTTNTANNNEPRRVKELNKK